jgi:acyl-CoA reductase-like NAD-dependent aldehyde dehydrogenase
MRLAEGVLNVVTNAPKDASDVVKALMAHPAVKHQLHRFHQDWPCGCQARR